MAVVEQADVREIWFAGPAATPWLKSLYEESVARDIPWRSVSSRTLEKAIGGIRLEVLHPEPGFGDPNENDHSLVLRAAVGGKRILFTGDIEAGAERELLEMKAVVTADILKVAHHGSQTSSTPDFLRSVRPSEAVVEAGFRNRLHHPAEAVLRRLKDSGIRVWRGDLCGEITFKISGTEVSLSTGRLCAGSV